METVSAHISVTSSRRRHVSKAHLVRAEELRADFPKGIGKLAPSEAKRNHRNRKPETEISPPRERRRVGAAIFQDAWNSARRFMWDCLRRAAPSLSP